ncbi:hypothetical protein IWQ60_006961 [Tieghemiomyces parasiticus]|uniref:Transcription elongation factor Eaf N-terminal domain-containing protein n=1 Tax=Tieghemiomyces parasiticus TaxID=78921 RepID=A0A9W8A115_9FUNG|nr:hypothetical protein IWQ60_006961 [Tieghemiomyces parasiticus]
MAHARSAAPDLDSDEAYPVHFGDTFRVPEDGEDTLADVPSFHALRYNFMPDSHALSDPGELVLNRRGQYNATFTAPETNEPHFYEASEHLAKDIECLLVFDEVTQTFTIEQLDSALKLMKVPKLTAEPATEPLTDPRSQLTSTPGFTPPETHGIVDVALATPSPEATSGTEGRPTPPSLAAMSVPSPAAVLTPVSELVLPKATPPARPAASPLALPATTTKSSVPSPPPVPAKTPRAAPRLANPATPVVGAMAVTPTVTAAVVTPPSPALSLALPRATPKPTKMNRRPISTATSSQAPWALPQPTTPQQALVPVSTPAAKPKPKARAKPKPKPASPKPVDEADLNIEEQLGKDLDDLLNDDLDEIQGASDEEFEEVEVAAAIAMPPKAPPVYQPPPQPVIQALPAVPTRPLAPSHARRRAGSSSGSSSGSGSSTSSSGSSDSGSSSSGSDSDDSRGRNQPPRRQAPQSQHAPPRGPPAPLSQPPPMRAVEPESDPFLNLDAELDATLDSSDDDVATRPETARGVGGPPLGGLPSTPADGGPSANGPISLSQYLGLGTGMAAPGPRRDEGDTSSSDEG